MNITDEMLEAAERAAFPGLHAGPYESKRRVRAAIEAVAPLIAAQALRSPDHVAKTVIATLRTVATWLEGEQDARTLRQVADQVERDPAAEWCCHVCEEVVCDGGCPFELARACGGGMTKARAT
jgi:hypothetical protein